LASLAVFYASRYFLRERTEQEIAKRPAYRAVDRACAKEGFKTVFTLRLSPLLPIPIGAYNYLYGVTSVSALDFIMGISLGSIKPYLLDSYLGLFGKSLIDDPNGGGVYSDVALLAFITVIILVGTFATEVAASTWEEIKKETAENDAQLALQESSSSEVLSDASKALSSSGFLRMMGVTAEDVEKLPGWLKGLVGDVFSAQNRVEAVIVDEVCQYHFGFLFIICFASP
jgi:SNARE associated Golgi protein